MTTLTEARPVSLPAGMRGIDHFTAADAAEQMGTQLRLIREAAPRFREWFAATGTPDYVGTFDLITLPYPTKFGLFRAHRTPAPFLTITNRMMLLRWREEEGRVRTLLSEPSDHVLGRNTPYFARLSEKTPKQFETLFSRAFGDAPGQLRRLGVDPAAVDYITFDHLHTQDVRRWLGTNEPAADISPSHPVEPIFPNAKLIVQRREMELLAADMHPLQAAWYQPAAYRDLRAGAVMEIDGDVLVGPGIALLATPGHTIGNHTLVLNTATGIWAVSENVIATECLTPEHSRIPGVARFAAEWQQDVILNANTIESTAEQYNSCIKEKSIVDRSRRDPRFLQYFPSSELTASRLSPGTAPTFVHGGIWHGTPPRVA